LKGGKDGSTEVSPDPAKAADYQAKFCKVSPTECGPGYGGDYKSAADAKALTFKQVANEVSFSSSVGDTKCTISGGTTLRCAFKNDKKKTSGEGILNRDANGKLSGSYIVEHNASGNVSSPKETKWEFSPKK
jgi:hypothetical protein